MTTPVQLARQRSVNFSTPQKEDYEERGLLESTPLTGAAEKKKKPEYMRKSFYRALAAEFLATTLFIFVVECALSSARPFAANQQLTFLFTAAAINSLGVVLSGMMFGPICGAILNPAVSVAAFLVGLMSPLCLVGYIVVQLLASIAGTLLTKFLFPDGRLEEGGFLAGCAINGISNKQAFALELVLTMILSLSVLALAFGPARRRRENEEKAIAEAKAEGANSAAELEAALIAAKRKSHKPFSIPIVDLMLPGLGIGLTVFVNILAGGLISGACMNPARALGPALVTNSSNLTDPLWIFFCAPTAGSIVAAAFYKGLGFLRNGKGHL